MSPHLRLLLTLGPGQLIVWALLYYIPAVTTGAVAAGLRASPGAVLGGFSLALLLTGLVSPVACRRIDRVGGRGVLLLGTVVQAAGLAIMATAGGLPQWYAGWAVAGLGMGAGLYDAAFATAGRVLGAAARPTITAITLIAGFASTLGWPLGGALVPWLGWRATLGCYAAALLLLNLPLYATLPRGVPPAVAARAAGEAAAGRGAFLCVAAFFTLRAVGASVVTIAVPALLAGMGLATVTATGLAALIGPAQVGMRVLQTLLGRAVTPLRLSWAAALLLPAALLPLLLVGPGGVFAAALLFVVGYGLSNGILTITRGTLPLFLFGPAGYATRIGQIAMPAMLGQAAAPLLFAPLLNAGSARTVLGVLLGLAVAAAACLLPLTRLRGPAPP